MPFILFLCCHFLLCLDLLLTCLLLSCICVIQQLKLQQVLEGSDVEKALATVSSNTIQGKMDKEHEKLVKDLALEHKKAN